MLRFVDICVALIFNRIYDGIIVDQRGLARVAEASPCAPSYLVPCHRSHVDYLALSLRSGAGLRTSSHRCGINLSFFPMGYIFRRSGAFFMRRTFRRKPPLRSGVQALHLRATEDGVNTEFFIEGTRTRTGKLLMPKYGMVKMIVEAWQSGACEDVQFVPVSIDYERIIEASSYQCELAGAEEERRSGRIAENNRLSFVQSSADSISNLGRCYHSSITLASTTPPRHQCPKSMESENSRLGFEILRRIADVCTVTPTAVISSVLLSHHGRGIGLSKFVELGTELIEFLEGATSAFSKRSMLPQSCTCIDRGG